MVIKAVFAIVYIMSLNAKDLGTHGTTFKIIETNLLNVITYKLRDLNKNGDLKRHQTKLIQFAQAQVLSPTPIHGLRRALKEHVHYYDPTYYLSYDLKDHQGRVFHKRGTILNPLLIRNLSCQLIFFSAQDNIQLEWIQRFIAHKKGSYKLILTAGSPIDLEEKLGQPCYFDQGGVLTKKFKIEAVPAIVSQEKFRLKIHEIVLDISQTKDIERD